MADAIPSATDDDIVTLLRCLNAKERDGIGREGYEELRRQVNLWINLRHRPDQEFLSLAGNFLEGLVDFGKLDTENLLRFISQFHARDRVYQTFLRHVVRLRKFELANEMLCLLQDETRGAWRNATQDAMARIAAAEGIALTARLGSQVSLSPLLICWYRLKGQTPPAVCNLDALSPTAARADYDYGPNVDVEMFFHAFFFSSLDIALSAVGECEPALVGIDLGELGWMDDGTRFLWDAAFEIAKEPSDINFGSIFFGLADLEPIDIQHRPSEPSVAQYRAFRSAVRQISTDLHALKCAVEGPSLIASEQFEIARASTHWVDESWISEELEARTLSFEPQGIKELIHELHETESKNVTQFSERAERWIDLAQLSVLYGLEGGERFVSRAADCIIGYGWRKDVWVFDVLSAIESIHEAKAADVSPWVETLAPIIDQITVFTDGDETNHAPEEFIDLIAVIKPEWLPNLYSFYMANEEWRLAEKTHCAILRHVDLTSPSGAALGRSLLEWADLYELEKLRKQGRAGVSKLLSAQRVFIGSAKDKIARKVTTKVSHKANGDDLGRKGRPPDVKKYGPDKLDALLKRVGSPKLGYLHREDSLLAWLRHWDRKGKGLEAVRSIDAYFKNHENPHEIVPLLDDAFEVSLKYEGKAKAYIWLVRAQIERHGWNYYWEGSERVQRRLERVAKHYKSKWAQFIKDTSKQPRYWEKRRNGLTIGTRWLVKFLLLVGQSKLATDYAGTMVRVTKDEVSDQPLPRAEWAQ